VPENVDEMLVVGDVDAVDTAVELSVDVTVEDFE
jgi:hypothetical protein